MAFKELVMFAWVPFSLVLFTLLRPRHAVLAAYLGAWLFLSPRAGLDIRILPDLDKVTIATFSVLAGIMLFDAPRLFTFRFRWFDVPMLAWCAAPAITSITNGLGYWDALSTILTSLTVWGIPYYIGRVYFNDWEGFRELAIAIFIGGLIYIPFCLFEIRFSPQLHRLVYGTHQHAFDQTKRGGGFRPMVFMQHGLAVGFWMTAASLVGVWLLVSGALKKVLGVPMLFIVPVLLVTTILCKSTAGVGFLFVGIAVLFTIMWTKTAIPLYCLVAVAPVYMVLRISDQIDSEKAVQVATDIFGPERALSLAYRLNAEEMYTAHALKRPLFGHGRWDPKSPRRPPWMVFSAETGRKLAVVDGLWLLTFAINGYVGLISLTVAVLLPPLLLRLRVPPQWWAHPMAAPAAAVAVLLTLYMADNLLNAMINPIFMMGMGGLAALGVRTAQPVPQAPLMQQQQFRQQQPAYRPMMAPQPHMMVGRSTPMGR